ncbi:hypothetical protein IAT38_002272 [Cryptococcus sp. DSM 104549]
MLPPAGRPPDRSLASPSASATPLVTSPIQTPRSPEQSTVDGNGAVRRTPSSYFSLPYSYNSPVGPSGWRRGLNESGMSLRLGRGPTAGEGGGSLNSPNVRSAMGRSYAGSLVTPSRPEGLDNWQSLHEMVGDDELEDRDRDLGSSRVSLGRLSQLPTPSVKSLRTLFTPSSPRSVTRPITINGGDREEGGIPRITDELSSSPGQLERGWRGVEGGYSPFMAPGEETPRAEARLLPETATQEQLPQEAADGDQVPLLQERAVPHAGTRTKKAVPEPTFLQRYWPPPLAAVNIFKCSLAYLVASLFTFVPALAALLSTQTEVDAHGRVSAKPAYSAHMVATIVVYFNPAKSLGNMLLSTRYCFVLAVIASVISMSATLTIRLFDHYSPSHGDKWDWISESGDWVVCILWIGGTMGALAWSKLWVGNPSFNSGCSMAAMILYTVVIKEGSLPKLVEILLIVLTGVCITNFICFTVFPVSATSKLQLSISKSLNSFSTLLDLLTSTFLLEKKRYGRIRGRKLELYDAAIGSLGRLAQHLSGLRSSTRLQESLIRASKEGKVNLDLGPERGLSKISMSLGGDEPGRGGDDGEGMSKDDIAMSVHLFMQYREMAGAQMDTLNNHCDAALEAVQALARHDQAATVDLTQIRANLAASLKDFTQSSSRAIKRVYAGPKRKRGVYSKAGSPGVDSSDSDSDSESSGGDSTEGDKKEGDGLPIAGQSQLRDGPNETVFWIYFFLFTFEEFSREMIFLVDTMEEIVTAERVTALEHLKSVFMPTRKRKERKSEYLYKQLQNLVPIDPSQLQPPLYPKNGRDSTGPVIVPEMRSLSWLGKIKQVFWAVGERLRQPDAKYAIKTGLGGAILAAPAYTEAGRPIFLQYRGEWALIAYFATMSQTIGQTNFLSMARVLGTLIGAGVAVLFSNMSPGNNIALPIMGFFFSIPCFYVITQMPDYMNAGRFVLLTYNLTCLYAYNTRLREESSTVEMIAFRRSTSVIVGVLWAAIVSRYWWPFTARRELRMGLSDFCLDLSYLYSKLVTTYSKGADTAPLDTRGADLEEGESEPLLPPGTIGHPHLSPSVRQFMAMELHLQSQLGSLKGLLAQTKNEPRLKGPFAYEFYHEVLLSCERMLDRLHSMRCVTTRDEWDNGIRQSFVMPVNKQRREMAGNVILYFYTLSAGFRLRTPVPPYLPPAEQARQRLVDAIRSLDVVRRRSVRGGGRHLLFFAYALAMQEVIAELEYLGAMVQDAFGVISHSTAVDFEELFEEPPEEVIRRGKVRAQELT